MIVVYGIPNCDTVKKARAWLTGRGIPHRFHDFKKDGVPADRLSHWLDTMDWALLVNRKGTTWRQLDSATASSGLTVLAVMVRPPEHDIAGARALGMTAVLIPETGAEPPGKGTSRAAYTAPRRHHTPRPPRLPRGHHRRPPARAQ